VPLRASSARPVRCAGRNETNHFIFLSIGVADDQQPQSGTQAEQQKSVFLIRVIGVRHQEPMLVGKRRLRFLRRKLLHVNLFTASMPPRASATWADARFPIREASLTVILYLNAIHFCGGIMNDQATVSLRQHIECLVDEVLRPWPGSGSVWIVG
jgi:hypothetical protein